MNYDDHNLTSFTIQIHYSVISNHTVIILMNGTFWMSTVNLNSILSALAKASQKREKMTAFSKNLLQKNKFDHFTKIRNAYFNEDK